ncbi:MAG TPA: SGNH/GDSL hydrolase family protein [Bryobacteraceae bacterium]|nr:SGNH/GDSL hydrolase family protein [Bryobacteraceae bacterium]
MRYALVIFSTLVMPCLGQQPSASLRWLDARQFTVEGQAWTDVAAPFDRLPARAQTIVREPVWDLSRDSAGIAVRFVTDAPTISARWRLRKASLSLPHMPATGVSGLDLYVSLPQGWHWVANGRPKEVSNEQILFDKWPGGSHEYMLYLPLYNGVESLEIGVPPDASLQPAPAYPKRVRPLLFYGSSITQGGCASRPGMAYPSIIGRALGIPTVNLGFSGNGKSEPEIAKLLAEPDPAVYVYDSLPNLDLREAQERIEPFLRILRQAHPKTPIVLVENVRYTNLQFSEERRKIVDGKNEILKSVYDRFRKEGDRNIHYIPSAHLLGDDGEATVDGTHPTDLGFSRMAEVIAKVLSPLVRKR